MANLACRTRSAAPALLLAIASTLAPMAQGTHLVRVSSSAVVHSATVQQQAASPGTAIAVSAGDRTTCAVLSNGNLKCFGDNQYGQLGQGTQGPFDRVGDEPGEMAALPPVDLGPGRTATAVSAGAYAGLFSSAPHCAILDNGTVKCWGSGTFGQLGQDSSDTIGDQPGEVAFLPPVNLGPGRTATAVSAGQGHTCALLDNGTVKCWGFGPTLGQGTSSDLGDEPGEMAALSAIDLGTGRTATAISAGSLHTCALLDNGTAKCWGSNGSGQLGRDTINDTIGDAPGEMGDNLPAINLGAGRTATAISAGKHHTCAILDNGSVKCWGSNLSGQLGQDSTADLGDQLGEMAALQPIDLGAGRTATAISTGAAQTCAILDNGTVKCWGSGSAGALGQDNTATLGDQPGEMAALQPINLGAGRTATAISAGAFHTCSITDDGTLKCWGYGGYGGLGQGSNDDLGDQPGEMATLAPVLLSPVATLDLQQSADEASVSAAGGVIHYHVTLSNTGNVPLTGIAVTDPNAPACAGPVANLAPGGSTTINCNHTATASDVGTYSNIATADTAETNPVGSNQVNVTVTIPTGSGRIAGVVTLSGSGSPVGGALVAALSPVDLSPVGIGIAKPDGRYAFLAPPGTYRLYTVDFALTGTAAFHPTTPTVTDGATTTVNPQLASNRATLAGTITDTNGAVANVVAMSIDLTAGGPGPGDLTDGSGRYSIGGLSPGPHLAQFVDPSGGHDREFHDDAATPAGSTILSLSSGATTTADATLATRSAPGQGSLIYGAVSSSGGGALSDVAVFAVNAADLSLARGAVTAGGGFYLIPLPAGSYKLAFYDPAGAHRFEWHADQPADAPGAATTVTVADSAVEVPATLTPTTATVSGTVTEQTTNSPLAEVLVVAIDPSGALTGAARTGANGSYTISGIRSGTTRLRFVDLSGSHTAEFFDDTTDPGAATNLATPAAAVLTGIDATLTPTP